MAEHKRTVHKKAEDKPVSGVSPKEERMYEHIKREAKQDHRYKGREAEVAARTVLKHHAAAHHRTGK